MDPASVFASAKWVGPPEPADVPVYILRGSFSVGTVKKAALRVVGLGFFECFLNGVRVSEDRFLPLVTDYEPRADYPAGETLTGHRILVPEYDVSSYLCAGENRVVIHFGGGWYDRPGDEARFGTAKAVWRVFGEDAAGPFDFGSSEADRISGSFITAYRFTKGEAQDLRCPAVRAFRYDFDDTAWLFAVPASAPETDYFFSDCPPDRVCDVIRPVRVGETGNVFDCGVNLTGTPVLRLYGGAGETVSVRFSEERTPDGSPDEAYVHGQYLTFVCGGGETQARALFTWFGFRYFEVEGPADVTCVEAVHADVPAAAGFRCDNGTLNWLHGAFVTTQLMNMHAGIPSDCPHLERRGYTGDGQLACHAAMTVLHAEAFYRKWIGDIRDCQDLLTGHVQYTAPYVRSGGGPGGWGCAIVEVPYRIYLHYGDAGVLKDCYPQMLRYFDYLENKSVNGLVTADKPGEWCLGDWCTPEAVILPPPFVNNYFYIKSLQRCVSIAPLVGREADLPLLRSRIEERKNALLAAYYNPMDGNFLGGRQGANAFALDIGLGDERTFRNLEAYYTALGGFDTGIFGTDIVTRVLFERGNGDLAVRLLTSESPHSFAAMKNRGATTLWEYFPGSLRDRSHSHPMFGAVAAYLYDYLLGVRQPQGEAGYRSLEISPCFVSSLSRVSGYRDLPAGRAAVSWERAGEKIRLSVTLPPRLPAVLLIGEKRVPLAEGENDFII